MIRICGHAGIGSAFLLFLSFVAETSYWSLIFYSKSSFLVSLGVVGMSIICFVVVGFHCVVVGCVIRLKFQHTSVRAMLSEWTGCPETFSSCCALNGTSVRKIVLALLQS